MRKYGKWLLGALALLCAFGLGRGGSAYSEADLARAREEAYNKGYHTGFDEGSASGRDALYQEAFAAGRTEGYDAGLTDGIARGAEEEQAALLSVTGDTYSQGYSAGYDEGYAKKGKDEQAARERYLASLQPLLPSVTPPSPSTDTPGGKGFSAAQEPTEQVVYVTNSGSKYHRASCAHLSKSKIEKTLSEAKAAGYEPCKTCKPPQ